ncbi:MAG: hypothetical protein ACLUUJ_05475 [Acutalibacteraceae bacterium]
MGRTGVFTVVLAGVLLLFSGAAADGVAQGVDLCLNVLIPSLFLFLVLAARAAQRPPQKGRWVAPTIILLSFIGGYPAGARSLSLLHEKGLLSRRQCAWLLCGCVNAGPPFVVTFVGLSLLHNEWAGWLLLSSCTVAALLSLGVGKLLLRPEHGAFPGAKAASTTSPEDGTWFAAVSQGARSLLQLCALVVVFSGLLSVLQKAGLYDFLNALPVSLPGCDNARLCALLLEVTTGCRTAVQGGCALPLLAFGLSFGGICVQLQVFSFFPRFPLKKSVYLLVRLGCAGVAALCCWGLLCLFPQALTVSAPLPALQAEQNPLPVLLLTLFLLLAALKGVHIAPRSAPRA